MAIEDTLYPLIKQYDKLPVKLKNILGIIFRSLPNILRYGNFYSFYIKRISQFQGYTISEVENESNKLLFKQVNRTLKNIKYYENYSEINSIKDFQTLPIITKEIITNDVNKFINSKNRKNALKTNTGGSSGTPFSFFIEKGITRSKEAAHFYWYWGKYGYNNGDRILMIRGKSLKNNRDFEYQAIGNKLVISCYNLNQESIGSIYAEILKFGPKFIHAYPSSLLTFTKELQVYLSKEKPKLNITAIFLGSENLFDSDAQYFENFYNSIIVNWFGHSECLIFGAKCQFSGDFHFFPFYGYIELVDEENIPITQPNKEGRILATGFDNNVMPLMRYDTGDIGILSPNKECSCGFKGTSLSSIIGRKKDYIILSNNTKVTLTAFIFGQHHIEFEKIKEMQIIQKTIGEIDLYLVVFDSFNSSDKMKLESRLESSVKKNSLKVTIHIVSKIEKTVRGKNKLLIQNLQI